MTASSSRTRQYYLQQDVLVHVAMHANVLVLGVLDDKLEIQYNMVRLKVPNLYRESWVGRGTLVGARSGTLERRARRCLPSRQRDQEWGGLVDPSSPSPTTWCPIAVDGWDASISPSAAPRWPAAAPRRTRSACTLLHHRGSSSSTGHGDRDRRRRDLGGVASPEMREKRKEKVRGGRARKVRGNTTRAGR